MRFRFLLSFLVLAANYCSIQSQEWPNSVTSKTGMTIKWRDATMSASGDAVEFIVTKKFDNPSDAKKRWIAIGLSSAGLMTSGSNIMMCSPKSLPAGKEYPSSNTVTHTYVDAANVSPKVWFGYNVNVKDKSINLTSVAVGDDGTVTCQFARLKTAPADITQNYLAADANTK